MKNVRSLLRVVCTMAICCAVLCTSVFANGPIKTYEIGGATYSFGKISPPAMSRAAGDYYYYDYTMTTSRTVTESGRCIPSRGDYFYIGVWNEGDTNLRVRITMIVDGTEITDEAVLEPGEGPYASYGDANPGEGMDCEFEVSIWPDDPGEDITFRLVAFQRP